MIQTLSLPRYPALVASLLALFSLTSQALATGFQTSEAELTAQERRESLAALIALLDEHYVLPEEGAQIVERIQANQAEGQYADIVREAEFARRITEDLRSVNGDRHLMLYPAPKSAANESDHYSHEMLRARGSQGNYGFREAKVLPGNVGVLRLANFSLDELYEDSCAAASAAMSFVANADALIIDLRDNPGGGARLNRYLSSYFFGEEPVHLNDYYFRTGDRTLEYWTLRNIPGRRMPDVPLFIIVNAGTFSSAEGFAYNLKHLGRAMIIGEASGGGSHGGAVHAAGPRFRAYIPFSRSIHPVTGTDFEGVGVQPDLAVHSQDAMPTAYRAAVDVLLSRATNEEDQNCYRGLRSALAVPSESAEEVGKGSGQGPNAGEGETTPDAIDRQVEKVVRQGALRLLEHSSVHSLSVGVVVEGQGISAHFGELDPGRGNLPSDDTIYPIASITKTMTGYLAAKAVLDGALGLEDDVREFLPQDYPNLEFDGMPVQIRHLLTHASHLPAELFGVEEYLQAGDISGALDHARQYDRTRFFQDLQAFELQRTPGSGYLYSSNGTNLLGYILESVYEKPYAALLEENLFAQAGMRSTALELNDEQRGRLAPGYDEQGNRTPEQPRFLLGADGFLKSTVPDLIRYLRFLLAEDNRAARESWSKINASGAPLGYFWQIEERAGSAFVKHAGTAFGATTWVILDPQAGLGIALVMNSRFPRSADLLYGTAMELLQQLR